MRRLQQQRKKDKINTVTKNVENRWLIIIIFFPEFSEQNKEFEKGISRKHRSGKKIIQCLE